MGKNSGEMAWGRCKQLTMDAVTYGISTVENKALG